MVMRTVRAVVAYSALAAGGCASSFGAFGDGAMAPYAIDTLPAPDPSTAASLLLDERVVRFREEGGALVARVFTRQQRRIHSAAGQEYRTAELSYDSTFEHVEAFEARVTSPDGRSVAMNTAAATDLPSLGAYYLYTDERLRTLPVPLVAPGSVVEVASLLRKGSPEFFAFSFTLGDDLPTRVARYVVEAPEAWEVEFTNSQPTAAAPVVRVVDGWRRYEWERRDLPAVQVDSRTMWYADVRERVAVRLKRAVLADGRVVQGPADDVELSRKTAELMAPSVKITPAIEQVVRQVLGDSWSGVPERERAAKLYAWTRDSIRYCAIEIGMGGWVPHASDIVEKVRYGDCKDKANLLKALLTVAGIRSRPVIIYSGPVPAPFVLPVHAANFNHAILAVDLADGTVIVDPTTRTVAFDDLPPGDEDRPCLLADEQGVPLIRTPASSPERDFRHAVADVQVALDGELKGTIEATLAGYHADGARDDLLGRPTNEHPKVVATAVGTTAELTDVIVARQAPPVFVEPVVVNARATYHHGGDRHSLANILKASDLVAMGIAPIATDRIAAPLSLTAKEELLDDVHLHLPPTITVEHLPPPVQVSTPLVSYEVSWTVVDDVLTLHRRLVLHENRLSTEQVPVFRATLAGYLRAMSGRVVLRVPTGGTP
jgi:transglutaminase-like putative cysteine protease